MIAATAYLALSVFLLGSTAGAFYPRAYGARLSSAASFAAMLLSLAVLPFVFLGLVVTAIAAWAGAFAFATGQLGLVIHAACWAVLLGYLYRTGRALPVLDGAPVRDHDHPFTDGLDEDARAALRPGRVRWSEALTFRIEAARDVEVVRDVVFREVGGVRLEVDIYRPRRADGPRPSAVYIHGGGWVMGNRRQSQFMMYEMAAAGWVVFAISYRLAPRHPLPAAIEDCKAGIAWARAHAAEYGADGEEPVVIGGSAGGHLAAMMALTPNRPAFQPGFEHADTRVRGAVVLYGVTDFLGAFGERPHPGLVSVLERFVIKARYKDDPERFRSASASSYLSADAPPMLLVHGTHDHVVPIQESRVFRERLVRAGAKSVHLLEVPLGLHAFEIVPSPLHQRAVRVTLRFMDSLRTPATAGLVDASPAAR